MDQIDLATVTTAVLMRCCPTVLPSDRRSSASHFSLLPFLPGASIIADGVHRLR